MSRDRLGKGLGALLGEYLEPQAEAGEVRRLRVSAIVPNPMQPRRVFTDGELDELTDSIRENGLLQPLVVRPAPGSADRYELVAGERRFRAVSRLEWPEVPVLVRDADDETLLVLALVENLQREALNPLEEAEGYEALQERFGMKHADIARAVGKDRSTIANLVRLLGLPPSIRKLVETGELSQGHARALLTIDDPVRAGELARKAAKEGWSVREVERRVVSGATKRRTRRSRPKDPVVQALEEALQDHLATRVDVKARRGGKGSIEIRFHDAEDFERLFERITGRSAAAVVE
jgi:ParB family transcriptional regulator, chromosome partitioning protein